jgi:hypothetical protein
VTQLYKIVVGYPWAKSNGEVILPRSDKRWQSIKKVVDSVIKEVRSRIERSFDTHGVVISVSRLRGMHGRPLLGELVSRLRTADLVILDIGSVEAEGNFNSNVIFELGLAIALHSESSGRVFVLKPKGVPAFSDLNGYLVADYISKDKELKIVDDSGFRAAIRSTMLNGMIERNIISGKMKAVLRLNAEESETGEARESKKPKRANRYKRST